MSSVAPRPVLKWAGGKWRVYDQLAHLIPRSYGRLFEPFIGGAALFLREWTRGAVREAALSDMNEELINLYRVIQRDPAPLVDRLIAMRDAHSQGAESYFYEVRDTWDVAACTDVERAARIVYLNKTCFNGLFRVNGKGKFNVPFGRYENPSILDEENLRAAHEAFASASLAVADFETAVVAAKDGDFVYFDPPYDPVNATSSFTSYAKDSFGRAEQRRLAGVFLRLSKGGVHCVLSNSDTPFIRETYDALRPELPDLVMERIEVARAINSKADRRGVVGEVIVATRRPADPAQPRLAQARLPS